MSEKLDKKETLVFSVTIYGRGAVIDSLLEQAGKLSEEYITGMLDNGDAVVGWRVVSEDEELAYKAQLEAMLDSKTKVPF